MRRLVSSVLVLSLGLAAVAAPDGGHWHQGGSVIVFTPLTSPSNPPAGTRGLYLDAASGEFKSITPEGATASLETQGGPIPAGLIMMSLTSCPGGFAEEATLSGKFVLGTVAANGDVAGTGGADNITPAGTNSGGAVSAHAGAAVADHAAHTHTFTGSSNAATPDLLTVNTAAAGVSASGTTGNPSATLTHSVTQPSAHTFTQPTFTGTQFDNRPAFVKVIFCRKT